MFSLLIVFIFLLAKMERSSAIPVNLARAGAEGKGGNGQPPHILTITKEGAYYLGTEAVGEGELEARLEAVSADGRPLRLRIDRDTTWRRVARAMAIIRIVRDIPVQVMVKPDS
jgi:biopolymer transport protein ExbD